MHPGGPPTHVTHCSQCRPDQESAAASLQPVAVQSVQAGTRVSCGQPGVCAQASWDMLAEGTPAPRLWSAEEPNLYILVLSLLGPQGDVIEAESAQVHPWSAPEAAPVCLSSEPLRFNKLHV